jgi:GT2 family glycosyltransferase/glycosyltransferase involved in cell wall biosynthesis
MDVSIIIPVYNALALTKQCVKSIFEHGSALSIEIIVVDNGSAPDVEEWGNQQQKEHANLRYMRYPEPLGFAKSVNTGCAAATGDVLIVLNSDTLVTPLWMDELYSALMDDPSLGALTPSTNHAGEPAQMDYGTIDLSAAKALALIAKRPKTPNILYLPQRLTFFCVAVRRDVWLKFDGLDEAYKVGNFEDDDLCLRLRVAGYRLGVAQHVFVYHHNNATFTANKISHGGWMSKNAATFAEHARSFAEADEGVTGTLLWPKRSGRDISVVVLPSDCGSLDRTLRSLANQTIAEFEVITPRSGQAPSRSWIAYVHEGDILYPFHLEALFDALERNGQEAIYADGWVLGADSAQAHPDVSKHIRSAPLLAAGWMHHSSLHLERIYDEAVPMYWPRLTWEMAKAPDAPTHPMGAAEKSFSVVETARDAYRKLVPLETRLNFDKKVRQLIGRPLPDPEQKQMQLLAAHLEDLTTNAVDAEKFATESTLPAIFMFNAISWNSVMQRQQHFARGLAERGHTVFWVEPALSPPRNWWSSRPLQQLAPGVHMLRLPGGARDIYTMEWNDAIVGAMQAAVLQTASAYGVRDAAILINYPRFQPIAKRLRERCGWKIASDCLDDQRALAGMYQTVLFTYEDWLVEHADLSITSSVVLQEKLHTRPSTLLHNAADYDLFSSAESMGYLAHLKKPVVGFFGALADWIDMGLVHAAAEHFPEWTFVFIGPHTFSQSAVEVEWLRATHLPNIVVIPQMDLRMLSMHLADFDVCTMPFLDITVTRSMNPVKLYEYLAAGKPVVCRDLPEVRHLMEDGAQGLISLYTTQKEFFEQLQTALAGDSDELRARRRAFAKGNDWGDRVDTLSRLLRDLIKG